MDLQLYGRDSSYNVQKVLWLAQELTLPLEHTQRGGRYGGMDTAEFVAMSPMQKVPVLLDQGRAIWESNTILRYLVERYGDGDWRVEDAYRRSEHERWMDWAQTKFESAFVGVFWGYYRTPESERDLPAITASVEACEACLSSLDRQLGDQAYLLGDQLSLADICNGVFLYRLVEIDLTVELPERVAVWYERLKVRPAFQLWVMRDFSELQGRMEY